MLIIRNVRVNPRYIKPKYGKGIFGSFAKLVSKAVSRIAQNKTIHKGINAAIAGGKSSLVKAATNGKKLAKKSLKNGYLQKGLETAVQIGTQLATNQANKGIDFAADALHDTINKKLSSDSPLRHISNAVVNSAKEKAKELTQESTNRLGSEILQRATDRSKGSDKNNNLVVKTSVSNKQIPRIQHSKLKQHGSDVKQSNSRIGKKRTRVTSINKNGNKRKKKIDWNDESLNSLIAKQ